MRGQGRRTKDNLTGQFVDWLTKPEGKGIKKVLPGLSESPSKAVNLRDLLQFDEPMAGRIEFELGVILDGGLLTLGHVGFLLSR
jgi:hypothetical protein